MFYIDLILMLSFCQQVFIAPTDFLIKVVKNSFTECFEQQETRECRLYCLPAPLQIMILTINLQYFTFLWSHKLFSGFLFVLKMYAVSLVLYIKHHIKLYYYNRLV